MKKLYLLLPLFLIITACEQYSQDSYKEYVVVESYAVANDTLPSVFVRTTGRADREYNNSDFVLNDADVQIVLLDESGADEEVYNYLFSSEMEKYIPVDQNHRMLPTRTYRLDVSFDDRPEVIQTTTTIPDDFDVINEIPETIVYQGGGQLELILSATEQTQFQNIFVFTAIALHARLDNMTPFYFASLEEDGVKVSDFQTNSSGLINEDNFTRNEDGTITLKYPWLGIAFYGETRIVTQSVDKNIADLVRSQDVQLGGSTLSPGEIPNLIYNVEGGIGVFGSLASDTVSTIILNPF